MADPVSITLGVIPLLGIAFKSYAAASKKISTFIHYSTTVARLQKKFRVQQRIFKNECHLLLQSALDDDAIQAMTDNLDHRNWTNEEIDGNLRDHLGESYDCCLDIIHEIQTAVGNVEKQLDRFLNAIAKFQVKVGRYDTDHT